MSVAQKYSLPAVGLRLAMEAVLGQERARIKKATFDQWMGDWRRANPRLNKRAVTRTLVDALTDRHNSAFQSHAHWMDRDARVRALEKALTALEKWFMVPYLPSQRRSGVSRGA